MNIEAFKKFDLTGKTAFVTGGGTGLGYFMSRGLARSGAKVMIAARRKNVLDAAAIKLSEESWGGEILTCEIDLLSRDSIQAASDHAINTMGGVDILVGNAAQECLEPLDSLSDDTVANMLQINVAANMSLTRNFLPHMRAKKWGRVIMISSNMSRFATENAASYITVKGALSAFVRAAAVDAGRDGITVNALCPGLHWTDIIAGIVNDLGPEGGKAFLDGFRSMIPLGRLGDCEDVEGPIQMLASDAGRYITGSEVTMDGGMVIMAKPKPLTA